ncbi:TRAP-type C4-dicarboxylate transport system permease small subunit [Hasllibacter halocynthiae]|uniref:TRAP transporter small permease protein n=1 Tax=Hasllibacter halocynthiae TaxID=595589 RepID=A0A2T0X936_9RHOB|nr:TRAP transporter small permease subunit [Hasllibacter halocynthiae]PRY95456.1 TRAP-type C4-dicarboxylate transport system permease small subunit [Hasllibacter halocynthiae]
MPVILGLLAPLEWVLTRVLRLCRTLALLALGIMVCVVLYSIPMRYLLNDAPAWANQLTLFFMIWMTGLMAPVAYRQGGFVAIDMLERALPGRLSTLLVLALTLASLVVLAAALPHATAHVQSGCLFRSATLWLPFTLELAIPLPGEAALTLCSGDGWAFGFEAGWTKMPNALTYIALKIGLVLLILVNVEMVLRHLATLLGGADRLAPLPVTDAPVAE